MRGKLVTLLCILFLCCLISSCSWKKPPTLGFKTDYFLNAYNAKIGDEARLRLDQSNLHKTSQVYSKKDDEHKEGYSLGNYDWLYKTFKLKVEGGYIYVTIYQDLGSGEIIEIAAGPADTSFILNYSNMNDIIKVFNTIANTISLKISGKDVSETLKIETLKQYNGQNQFSNIVDQDNITYNYKFRYRDNGTVGIEMISLDIECSESVSSIREKSKNHPKGVVPNPEAGNHTVDLTSPSNTNSSLGASVPTRPQVAAPKPTYSSQTQPKQNEQPPKPRMKKEIPGKEAINGFWNGDPNYPVIGVSGNMTKIADKSSVKFSKSEHEELISMDVYGFKPSEGQCWQETYTFLRKGRTSNYFSSIADNGRMLMELVKDAAVHEAYRIACETAGVPSEMAPSR